MSGHLSRLLSFDEWLEASHASVVFNGKGDPSLCAAALEQQREQALAIAREQYEQVRELYTIAFVRRVQDAVRDVGDTIPLAGDGYPADAWWSAVWLRLRRDGIASCHEVREHRLAVWDGTCAGTMSVDSSGHVHVDARLKP